MIREMIFLYLKRCFTNYQDKQYIQSSVKHFFTTKSPCLISCSRLVGWLVRISVTFSFYIVPKSLSSFSFFIVLKSLLSFSFFIKPKSLSFFSFFIVLKNIYHLLAFLLCKNLLSTFLFYFAVYHLLYFTLFIVAKLCSSSIFYIVSNKNLTFIIVSKLFIIFQLFNCAKKSSFIFFIQPKNNIFHCAKTFYHV